MLATERSWRIFSSAYRRLILFSFYHDGLYKISVTYDRTSTRGLTAEDMVKSISAKYGPARRLFPCLPQLRTSEDRPILF